MKTYDEILASMTQRYSELSGFVPCEESDVSIRLKVLAGEVYSALVEFEWLRRQMFVTTATDKYLDYHGAQRGLSRREASYAQGEVIFTASQTAQEDIVIPEGTVVATAGENPLYFETVEEVIIYSGTTAAHALCESMTKGRKYNVSDGAVCNIVTSVANVTTVTNPDPFTDGADAESDDEFRARIADSYKNASNGTNCAYYKNVALETSGVAGAGVVPRGRGVGTVDVYIAGEGSEVTPELLNQVQNRMSQLREVNVDVLVKEAHPVAFDLNMMLEVEDGYDFDEVRLRFVQVLKDYIATCGVGGKVLLTEIGERVYHLEGVKEYMFVHALCSDLRLAPDQYPVVGDVYVTQGVE